MPVRSLNGLDSSVRSLNGLSDRIDYTVSLPLTMNSDYNIKLSNLNSYGSANQILKMNSAANALEYATETDTTYTTQTPLVKTTNNVIGLNGLSGYGSIIGQRQLIRTNANNTGLEYFDEPDLSNFITSTTLPNLVAGLTTFGSDSAGLTNFGATNHSTNLYGNVIIKNITTVNSGHLYVYGIGGLITASTHSYSFPVGGGTLVSSNTIVSSVSVLNNFGTSAISNVSLGKIGLDTLLYGNIKLQNTSDATNGNILLYNAGGLVKKSTLSYTLPTTGGTLITNLGLSTLVGALTTFGSNSAGHTNFGATNFDTNLFGNVKLKNISPNASGNFLKLTTDQKITSVATIPLSSIQQIYTSDIEDSAFDIYETAFVMVNNYIVLFSVEGNTPRNLLFSSSNADGRKYRHNIGHSNTAIKFYTGDNSQTTGTTNILDISTSGLKLVKCDTVLSGHLLINSSGIVKQSANAFTLPTSTGTLALTSDISSVISTSTTFGSNSASTCNFGATNQSTLIFGNVKFPNITPNVSGNILILGANQSLSSIATIPITSIDTINYWNIAYRAMNINYTANYMEPYYVIITKPINGQNLFIADTNSKYRHNIRHTTNSIGFYLSSTNDFTTGSNNSFNIMNYGCSTDRVNFTNPANNLYSKIDHGGAYGHGPDIMGHTGVKLWARDSNNTNDVRFYVLASLANCRADFYVDGNLKFYSDDRLKTDEEDLPFNCLELLDKMKPKQYKKYNDKLEYTHNELGLIAQDTWNVVKDNDILRDIFVGDVDYNLPSNFKENGDLVEDQQKINDKGEIITNYLYINYISFVPILIQSVKDLYFLEKSNIKKLEEQINQQQEQINQQQEIINTLINSTTFANFRKNI